MSASTFSLLAIASADSPAHSALNTDCSPAAADEHSASTTGLTHVKGKTSVPPPLRRLYLTAQLPSPAPPNFPSSPAPPFPRKSRPLRSLASVPRIGPA
ncbi:hypothetical protein C8J57DRAFT_1527813 [Mycena rebaudengoi]|nr:hypothetical protein C8J57DRAFT_1527813 [Mycena rebaudengoi]